MIKPNRPSNNGPHQLIADLYAPQPATIACSQAERLIALAADNLFDDATAQSHYPDLFLHLQSCETCTDVYDMVMEYARLEASSALPNPPRIPALPAELRPAPQGWAGELLRILFPGFAPVQPVLALRGRLDLPPVAVALGDEGLQVELQVQPSTASPELRTLHCTFTAPGAAESGADVAAVTVSLELAATGEVEQTQTGDLPAEMVFLDIAAELYALRIESHERTYLIEQLGVP